MSLRYVGCPEPGCDAPSAVIDEEMWSSTTGGLVMAKVMGSCGHGFLMPAWKLDLANVVVVDDRSGNTVAG